LQSRKYRDAKPFEAPDGVVSVTVDSLTGMPATPFCPETRNEVFIAGTQPVGTCPLHGGRGTTYASSWEAPATPPTVTAASAAGAADPAQHKPRQQPSMASSTTPEPASDQASKAPKKKGIFRRLMDVFK
jgi:membrane carboxypeptidase/penicillin-binding protein